VKLLHTDCLVIGAGLAGSAYALRAAKLGLKVELLSLAEPLAANSDWAQGGIIYDTTPDPESLARDIVEASDHTANPRAVEHLVREGPTAVEELLLDDLRVGFDRAAAWHHPSLRLGRDRPAHAVAQLG
jgi:L-aspartate oxidase